MFVTHDQDVTVYSMRPDGRLQVIGLRFRTYLLDYGGKRSLVLFSTTIGTGVLTHGPEHDSDPNRKVNEIPGEIAGVPPVDRE